MKRNCDICGEPYEADERNLKRGWGLCCSKRCAAKKRERRNQSMRDKAKFKAYKEGQKNPFFYRPPTADEWTDGDQWDDCDFGRHD